ncbi:hypothetical protein [Streptococcus dysgalactiae]|uniref:hypothetical protein n=1 Tax=Streptococcus dysgalactiae TaxID=1334 RepID=UPI00194FF967|nr:hypothetical protein [Streptococcus dysgalactiae]
MSKVFSVSLSSTELMIDSLIGPLVCASAQSAMRTATVSWMTHTPVCFVPVSALESTEEIQTKEVNNKGIWFI